MASYESLKRTPEELQQSINLEVSDFLSNNIDAHTASHNIYLLLQSFHKQRTSQIANKTQAKSI
jgi:hypothetical protein